MPPAQPGAASPVRHKGALAGCERVNGSDRLNASDRTQAFLSPARSTVFDWPLMTRGFGPRRPAACDLIGPHRTSNSSGRDLGQHALTQASDYIKLHAYAPDDVQLGHQVSDFIFDDSKRFADNCAAFLESVKEIDPEMAALLEANWCKLLAVVCDGERDSKARTTFNEAIAAALDDLLTQDAEAEDE